MLVSDGEMLGIMRICYDLVSERNNAISVIRPRATDKLLVCVLSVDHEATDGLWHVEQSSTRPISDVQIMIRHESAD